VLYVQQIPLRHSGAVRLGFNTLQNSVLFFSSTAGRLHALHVTCSRRERVGERVVGSKEPLRIMGIRAVWLHLAGILQARYGDTGTSQEIFQHS
jgi:hypothetical protein